MNKIFISLVYLFLTGCAMGPTYEQTANKQINAIKGVRESYVGWRTDLSEDIKIAIRNGRVVIGMRKVDVEVSCGLAHIKKSVGSWGVHEHWTYPGDVTTISKRQAEFCPKYLYFENGILTSWQE